MKEVVMLRFLELSLIIPDLKLFSKPINPNTLIQVQSKNKLKVC